MVISIFFLLIIAKIITMLHFFLLILILLYNINCQEPIESSTLNFSYNTTISENISDDTVDSSTLYSNDFLINNNKSNTKNDKVIKIGHIGSLNAMPGAESILEMCRNDLWSEGILNDNFDIELIQSRACGQSYEGVAVAADMFH
uniref:Guanylate cyclase (inferred by orthology to a zebrafish protein) n=1 Tax=Strongyloides venezuelensis TaxID=75913 RepID=A0A0K0FX55_STRVS